MNPKYFITAYEIAVKHGFRGTEEEWLTSLTAFYLAQQAGYQGTVDDWIAVLNDPVPNIQIGEVVTLPGGSEATASLSGDKRHPLLNLGIPRGIGMVDALPIVGGKMKGSVDMDGFSIQNLPDPTKNDEAANKKFVEETIKNKAESFTFPGVFSAVGWSSEAPYTQVVRVEGLLEDDEPVVDIDLSGISDPLPVIEAWGMVHRCSVSADDTVTVYCYQAYPLVDIPVVFKVVR